MRAVLQALVAAALFGAATPVSKQLLADLAPNTLAGLLYLGAALVLLPIVVLRLRRGERVLPADRRNRIRLLLAVLCGGICGPVLLLIGLAQAQASSVSMWLNLETVATAIIAAWMFREHLGPWAWIGNLGVVVAGVLLGYEGGWHGWMALVCVAGAAVMWGLDNNLTAVIDTISPEDMTFWKGLAAGAVNLSLGLALQPQTPDGSWLSALVVGGLAYGISVALYIRAAQSLGASRSQMVFSTAPFFGVLLSAVLLSERLTAIQWLAMGVVVGGIVLIFVGRHAHAHEHAALDHDHEHRHDDGHHGHRHPGLPANHRHQHGHHHEAERHAHPHWPDLHHRHAH